MFIKVIFKKNGQILANQSKKNFEKMGSVRKHSVNPLLTTDHKVKKIQSGQKYRRMNIRKLLRADEYQVNLNWPMVGNLNGPDGWTSEWARWLEIWMARIQAKPQIPVVSLPREAI